MHQKSQSQAHLLLVHDPASMTLSCYPLLTDRNHSGRPPQIPLVLLLHLMGPLLLHSPVDITHGNSMLCLLMSSTSRIPLRFQEEGKKTHPTHQACGDLHGGCLYAVTSSSSDGRRFHQWASYLRNLCVTLLQAPPILNHPLPHQDRRRPFISGR